jgi:HEAT repeat protein
MKTHLEQLIGLRSQLVEEVMVYLTDLAHDMAQLPAYFPSHLSDDETSGNSFDNIIQRVYAVEDRKVFELMRTAGAEKARNPSTDFDRLAYAPFRALPEGYLSQNTLKPIEWDEKASERFQRAVILGDPGFGKTWLLRSEARRLALKGARDLIERRSGLESVVIPIFMRLSDLNRTDDLIESTIVDLGGRGRSVSFRRFLRRKLESDMCLILLDGWDEIPEERPQEGEHLSFRPHHRQRLKQRLESFASKYKDVRLLVTSRIVGYLESPIGKVPELELVAFDQPQIESFVRVWFGPESAMSGKFLDLLAGNPQVMGLGRIPLMLALMCRAYGDRRNPFPMRRTGLYERCLRGLLKDWKEEKQQREISGAYVEAVIELLEYVGQRLFVEKYEQFGEPLLRMVMNEQLDRLPHNHELCGRTASSIIEELKQGGIFVRSGAHSDAPLLFLHRTFHEHLTARHLAKMKTDESLGVIRKHCWYELDWEEVILQLAGVLEDPTPLIEAMLYEDDDIFNRTRLLAGRCLLEATGRRIPKELKERVLDALSQAVSSGTGNTTREIVVLLSQMDDPPAVAALVGALDNENNDVADTAFTEMLKLLESKKDTFVEPLIRLLMRPSSLHGSDRAAIFLGAIGDSRAIPDLRAKFILSSTFSKHDLGDHSTEFDALLHLKDPWLAKYLEEKLRDTDEKTREKATHQLGRFDSDVAVPLLVSALKDKSGTVRIAASEALARINTGAAVKAFFTAFRDEDWKARYEMRLGLSEALSFHRTSREVESLITKHITADGNMSIVNLAISLEEHKAAEAVDALIDEKLNHKGIGASGAKGDEDVEEDEVAGGEWEDMFLDWRSKERTFAEEELAPAANNQATVHLHAALHDEDEIIRVAAATVLGRLRDISSVAALLPAALEDESSSVRREAQSALVKIGEATVVKALEDFLTSKNVAAACSAANLLGQFKDRSSAGPLINALGNQDRKVRAAAAKALGMLAVDAAVEPLIARLDDSDYHVKQEVLNALTKIGGQSTIIALRKALDCAEGELRWRIVSCIAVIPDESAVAVLTEIVSGGDRRIMKAAKDGLLRKGGDRVLNVLVELLSNADRGVRAIAAEALGEMGGAEAAVALSEALKDEDYWKDNPRGHLSEKSTFQEKWRILIQSGVRSKAAQALGRVGGQENFQILLDALEDPSYAVRTEAAIALGTLGNKGALDHLVRVFTDEHSGVRQAAAESVGKIDSSWAKEQLRELLTDESPEVRLTAAGLLVRASDRTAISPLIELLGSEKAEVRAGAAEHLGLLRDQSAAAALITALNDNESMVREKAANALSKVGDKSAITALRHMVDDWDKSVAAAAARALVQIGGAGVAHGFVWALQQEDHEVREMAEERLSQTYDDEALRVLVWALLDEISERRDSIKEVLEKIKDERLLRALIEFFDSTFDRHHFRGREEAGDLLKNAARGRYAVQTYEMILSRLGEKVSVSSWELTTLIDLLDSLAPYVRVAVGDEWDNYRKRIANVIRARSRKTRSQVFIEYLGRLVAAGVERIFERRVRREKDRTG